MPAARATEDANHTNRRLAAALVLGIAIGAAGAMLIERSLRDGERMLARASAPDNSRVAIVIERPCGSGICQSLRIGANERAAREVRSTESRLPTEIAWTPDGKRVGFVVNGVELVLYDSQSSKEAGTVRLMSAEASQTRFARGVTFSANGRAVTFDDCPRAQSGCRAGVVGVPQ